MGILSSGFRAKVVFAVVVECKELVVVVPPERLPRRAVRGLGEHSAQRLGFGCCFWSVSSSSSGSAFFLLGQSAIRKRTHQGIGARIMTYSGREEERAPSIYRSSSLVALSGDVEGAPFQRVFLPGREGFSFSVKVPPSISVFQLSRTLETSPSSWAWTRPVAIRQRSTAS